MAAAIWADEMKLKRSARALLTMFVTTMGFDSIDLVEGFFIRNWRMVPLYDLVSKIMMLYLPAIEWVVEDVRQFLLTDLESQRFQSTTDFSIR